LPRGERKKQNASGEILANNRRQIQSARFVLGLFIRDQVTSPRKFWAIRIRNVNLAGAKVRAVL
jgi:hypothetical protein